MTAGVAATAYAGIPVTHRGLASAVALVTGHAREDAGDAVGGEEGTIDWPALAGFPGTLVLYMGVRQLPQIAAALIAAGRPGSQAAAVVEAGTLPAQRTVTATLETIAEVAAAEGVRPPAITVVGPVAALAAELAWLAPGPLAGLTVAVTRARAQASGLARRLQELGARVVQAPVIRVEALPGPALDPSPYDLICLTSPNGVAGLFERLDDGTHPRGDARSLARAKIAAIGPGTARALAERGVVADVVPERFVAESLVEALAELPVSARWWRGQARRATCSRTRCARAAPRSTCWRCTRPSPSRSRRARCRRCAGRLRHLHLVLDGALLPAGHRRRAGACGIDADRLDRPGDERDAARAWARARHRGGDVRRRGYDRGAARRRRSTGKQWPIAHPSSPSSPTTASSTSSSASATA